MNKKLYTGAYLLNNSENSSYYGIIDGSYSLKNNIDKCKILIRKTNVKNLLITEKEISFELNSVQLDVLAKVSREVFENLRVLKLLSNRNKLNESSYIEDDE